MWLGLIQAEKEFPGFLGCFVEVVESFGKVIEAALEDIAGERALELKKEGRLEFLKDLVLTVL